MQNEPLKLLVIGAHPDDPDVGAGGLAIKYRRLGHTVKFVSVTNGAAGHHQMSGQSLIARRQAEAKAAGALIDIQYEVWEHPDGELEPTLKARKQIIRLIRQFCPDLLLTHRPNDYHPDHRYTSQLVQDAAYLVTVPNICPETPALQGDLNIMYLRDEFKKPYPFSPTIAINIDDEFETKVDMFACHVSQAYEWLPYNGLLDVEVPTDPKQRRCVLMQWFGQQFAVTDQYRELLAKFYSTDVAKTIRAFEAFEPCEYGAKLDVDSYRRLFPFLPKFSVQLQIAE